MCGGERLRQGVRSVSCLDGGAVDAITAAARIHWHWRPAGFKSLPSKPSSKLECKEPEIFRRGRDILSSSFFSMACAALEWFTVAIGALSDQS